MMTPEEKRPVFGAFVPDAYAEEARERWRDTDAFAESSRRTASYTTTDWERIRDEAADIHERFVALELGDVAPGSDDAAAVVGDHRQHISRWFYACGPDVHAALGRMYVADARFTENIDRFGDLLAAYMSAAIEAAYEPMAGGAGTTGPQASSGR